MVDGRIAEMGTYEELIARNGAFSKYVSEFGGEEEEEDAEGKGKGKKDKKQVGAKKSSPGSSRVGPSMMQTEERNTGAVTGEGVC